MPAPDPRFRDLALVSGGQTGADRAALDFARVHGFRHGGWCPRGRRAEDGAIPEAYALRETESRDYAQRTRRNVEESDATVALTLSPGLSGGTAFTLEHAAKRGKPWLHLAGGEGHPTPRAVILDCARRLREFVEDHAVHVLNVAGPRASGEPRIAAFVHAVLEAALLGAERPQISWWLLPAEPRRREVAVTIARLAKRHPPSVPFAPHLTLFSTAMPDQAVSPAWPQLLTRVGVAHAPIALEATHLHFGDPLQRAFYVGFASARELGDLVGALAGALGVTARSPELPHVSLLYARFAPADLAEEQAQLREMLLGPWRFDAVQPVETTTPFERPEQAAAWRPLCDSVPLGRSRP